MKILLTGFEPFGGSQINPSEQIVNFLDQNPPNSLHLVTAILPVDKDTGPPALIEAIHHHQPQAVISLGEARGRAAISIERVGLNLMDYTIADNAGNQITDQPIIPDSPAAYFSTLPVRTIFENIQKSGIPVQLSLTAGAFLCNQITYTMLHFLAENAPNTLGGFIHFPSLPQQVSDANPPKPSMHLNTMIQAVNITLQTLVSL